jgi:hypothetical protein
LGQALTDRGRGPPRDEPGQVDRGLLRLVIKKLSSQALLFSLGMAVLLIGAARWLGIAGGLAVFTVLFIFGSAMLAYLFFEQKQKLARGDPATTSRLLQASAAELTNTRSSFSIEVWTSRAGELSAAPGRKRSRAKSSYRVGESITVFFRSNRDCYLTLLNIGSSGKLTVLFPNGDQRENFTVAGRTYQIPGADAGFEFQLQGPPGLEKLKAIATLTRRELLESNFAPDGSVFWTVPPAEGARNIAVIQRHVTGLPAEQWAEAECEFEVKGEPS